MDIQNITFDRHKHPGIEFDLFPLEEILARDDLNPSPLSHHRVKFYILILVISEDGKHTIDFKEHSYCKGSVLTIRKDQIHKFHRSSAKGFVLLFTEEFVLSYLEDASAKKIAELFNEMLYEQHSNLTSNDFDEILFIVSLIKREFHSPYDDHTSGNIRNLLQVMIGKIYRFRNTTKAKHQDHKYTQRFLNFQHLVEEYCTQSKTVQFYADKLNLTPKTLNNITRQILNKNAKTFIDQVLTLQIKRHLINTTLTTKEIAYATGFDEPTNLFKFFKKHTNQTPESFRNRFSTRT